MDRDCIKNGCDNGIKNVKTISESYVNKTDDIGDRPFDYLFNQLDECYNYVDSYVLVKKK